MPERVAIEADSSSILKSWTVFEEIEYARFSSILFASIGPWKEFEILEQSIRILNKANDTAILPVRDPAILAE